MREFQETRKMRGVLSSWPVLVALVAVSGWLTWSIFLEYLALREVRSSRLTVSEELNKIEQKNQNLRRNLEQIDSGFGLEKIARERFNVKKPGEEMFIIVEEPAPKDAGRQSSNDSFLWSLWATVKNIF